MFRSLVSYILAPMDRPSPRLPGVMPCIKITSYKAFHWDGPVKERRERLLYCRVPIDIYNSNIISSNPEHVSGFLRADLISINLQAITDIGHNTGAGRGAILVGNRGKSSMSRVSLSFITPIFLLSLRLLEKDYIKVLHIC